MVNSIKITRISMHCIRHLLAATLGLALTFTLGCEEKSGDKAKGNTEQTAVAEATEPAKTEETTSARAGSFIDERDGKSYKWVKIGEQIWMAENLNFNEPGSQCYGGHDGVEVGEGSSEDSECSCPGDYKTLIGEVLSDSKIQANCDKYGRLYELEAAEKVCPNGWHTPDKEEWQTLVDFVGGKKIAGKKLKAKSGWDDYVPCVKYGDGGGCKEKGAKQPSNGTDDYGFSALPSGYYYREGADCICDFYQNVGEGSCFGGAYRIIINQEDQAEEGEGYILCSMRCIKD